MNQLARRRSIRAAGLVCLLTLIATSCSASPAARPPITSSTAAPSSTIAPSLAAKPVAAVEQCPSRPIPVGLSTLDVPGSPLSLEAGPGVPSSFLAQLAQYFCMARASQGDSGPLAVHVFASLEDFVAAYNTAYPGSTDRIKNLVAQGLRAETRPGNVWFSPNVFGGGPTVAETAFHEYFHTVQNFLIGRSSFFVPVWLLEGTALFFGFSEAQTHGLDDFAHFRSAELAVAKQSGQPLNAYEKVAPGTVPAPAYALGFLAAEYLNKVYGIDRVHHDFWAAMASTGDWKVAFQTAFSVSTDQFYADFEAYRQNQL